MAALSYSVIFLLPTNAFYIPVYIKENKVTLQTVGTSLFFLIYLFGKDYNPCFTNRYTTGYLQYFCTSL